MFRTIYLAFIIMSLAYACASGDCVKKMNDSTNNEEQSQDEMEIDLKQVFVWINMMPGPDFYPRINITGDIEITKSPENEIDRITLSVINIYQNNLQFYSIQPIIRFGENPSSDDKLLIIFSTKEGMNVKENFDIDTDVDVEFIFELDDKTFLRYEKNLVIQKAY